MSINNTLIDNALNEMKERICSIGKAPILFIGSGLSQRYYGTPNWKGLLKLVAFRVGLGEWDIEKWGSNEEQATELEYYAFASRRPDCSSGENRRTPLRKMIQEILSEKSTIIEDRKYEVDELAKIIPTAIVTTNYDDFLEKTFGDSYDVCVGQDVVWKRGNDDSNTIYKIHGCIRDPETIVITREDYDRFMAKSKYLYAKLMTLFWENPVVFMGYSISDDNVKSVLDTMLEVMTDEQRETFSQRVWILSYANDGKGYTAERFEKTEIITGRNKVSIKCFYLDESYQRFYKTLNEAAAVTQEKKLRFSISDNAIDLLIKPLYQKQNNFQVVVRELLQNAQDACKKANRDVKVDINVIIEGEKVKLKVSDYGIGMDWNDVIKYFLTIGKTSKTEEDFGLTGKFGIGILSVFLIGKEAKVYSRKNFASMAVGFRIFEEEKEKKVDKLSVDGSIFQEEGVSTIIEVNIDDAVSKSIKEAKNIGVVKEILGLKDYYVWENSKITIIFKEENQAIDVFERKGMHQIADDFYIEKFYEEDSKYRNLKGKALINDMVVNVRFKTLGFSMVKDRDIPFFAINIKKEYSGNVIPSLSRSGVDIEGRIENDIISYIYEEEAEKVISGIEQSIKDDKASGLYFRLNLIPDCKLLRKQNVSYKENCIVFSKEYKNIIQVYGSQDVFVDLLKTEECDYRIGELNKSNLGDIIEDDRAIGVGIEYLKKYILHATGSYNGFRMGVIKKIFEKIKIKDIPCDNSTIMWKSIIQKKEELKEYLNRYLDREVLWFDEKYKSKITQTETLSKLVIAKAYKKPVDKKFLRILKDKMQEKQSVKEYLILESK